MALFNINALTSYVIQAIPPAAYRGGGHLACLYYMSYGHFFQFRISFSGSALPGNKDNERLSEKLLIFDFDGILGIDGKKLCVIPRKIAQKRKFCVPGGVALVCGGYAEMEYFKTKQKPATRRCELLFLEAKSD